MYIYLFLEVNVRIHRYQNLLRANFYCKNQHVDFANNALFDLKIKHGMDDFHSAKDEGLGACAQTRVRRRIFFVFPHMVRPQVMKSTTKNTSFFVSLIKLLVKFVVLQSHSQSICVLNQCHIKINTHLFSQYLKLFAFLSNFLPTRNLSHCCFCFHSTDLQQYNQKCFLSERRKWKAKHFFHKTKELTIPINNNKKSKFFWMSLISLRNIWSLSKLNTNRYGNCFDQFHFELQPKREKIYNLGNFFIFAEGSGKSSEIWVGFAANDFVFFPLSF